MRYTKPNLFTSDADLLKMYRELRAFRRNLDSQRGSAGNALVGALADLSAIMFDLEVTVTLEDVLKLQDSCALLVEEIGYDKCDLGTQYWYDGYKRRKAYDADPANQVSAKDAGVAVGLFALGLGILACFIKTVEGK